MTDMVLATQHSLRIASVPENLVKVERLVEEVCKDYGINEDCYANILVALTEAVNNAIHHGNRRNASLFVSVELENAESHIQFLVEDQGPGFNFNDLPDPTDPANLEKENGRGIFLMKHLADAVDFQEDGRRVILRFKKG